jgi:protein TonB
MGELGNLSQCMVDSDGAAKTRARRLRRKALAASILLEAAVIAGIVIWPLMTLGVLPSQAVVTPLPPYRGFREPQPIRPELPGAARDYPANRTEVFQPPTIPPHIMTSADPDSAPGIDANERFGAVGDFLPGGSAAGPVIEIARPAQPPPRGRILVRSGSLMEALLVHRVQPEYPGLAKRIGLSGTVVLRARIGTDGKVSNLEVVSGNAILARSALEAVREWRYQPTTLNGQAVEVETQITVNFVLNAE